MFVKIQTLAALLTSGTYGALNARALLSIQGQANRKKVKTTNDFYRRNGVVVRASALQSVDLGFSPQVESYHKLKNGIHCFLPSLLCPWVRHLTECLHLHVADRWWDQAVYPLWWSSLTKDVQTEHELIRMNKLNEFLNTFAPRGVLKEGKRETIRARRNFA